MILVCKEIKFKANKRRLQTETHATLISPPSFCCAPGQVTEEPAATGYRKPGYFPSYLRTSSPQHLLPHAKSLAFTTSKRQEPPGTRLLYTMTLENLFLDCRSFRRILSFEANNRRKSRGAEYTRARMICQITPAEDIYFLPLLFRHLEHSQAAQKSSHFPYRKE